MAKAAVKQEIALHVNDEQCRLCQGEREVIGFSGNDDGRNKRIL